MIPKTLGNDGRVARIQCVPNDRLDCLNIKNNSFALIIIHEGYARFEIDGTYFDTTAPCFICFDEHENPTLVKKKGLKCDTVYFDPVFLNVNMTFDRVHSESYGEIADIHDLFLLMPFTERKEYVFPIPGEFITNVKRCFEEICSSLNEQEDWYWSCRSRSYFTELMLVLERTYGYIGRITTPSDTIKSNHLRKAIIYIESNYRNPINLTAISAAASINHTTLTKLFKDNLGVTPIEYLWSHRLKVAKKQLEFTELPLKDISCRCGFKTVQHFCRKFEQETGYTPSSFREYAVQKRKQYFN